MKKDILINFIFTFVTSILMFIINKYFVFYMGISMLGIMKLFNQLLYYLNLAELGVGGASTYAFYKPLSEGNKEEISIILSTISSVYNKILIVICIIGLSITPFVPMMIKDEVNKGSIYLYWILYVINTAISYLFIKYSILFTADQKFYLVRIIQGTTKVVSQLLQILVLVFFQNFIAFIVLMILENISQYFIYKYYYKKDYGYIQKTNKKSDSIFKDTINLFWHKLAAVVVFNTDLILISKFVSLEFVGIYASYQMILQMIVTVFNIIINVLKPKVGKFIAENKKETVFELWKRLDILCLFFTIVTISSTFYLIDDFIGLWLGKEFIFPKLTLILIIINFFVRCFRMNIDIFKDGDGFFEDIYLPILEAVINFIASLILVYKIGLNGVIIGTILSNVLIICLVRPILVFKRTFAKNFFHYVKIYTSYILLVMISIIFSKKIIEVLPNLSVDNWGIWIKKAIIITVINFFTTLILFLFYRPFRKVLYIQDIFRE